MFACLCVYLDSLSYINIDLWNSPGKKTGVGGHFLLQGDLPDPGIEPGSSELQADSLPSEPQGKPKI